MKNLFLFCNLVILLSVFTFSSTVFSEAVPPSPDGGDIDSSPANIEGILSEATPSVITITEKKNGKKVKVKLTENTSYFTAFGGLVRPDELRPGQIIWVWYKDCDSAKNEVLQKAKAVKIFSLDPNDKP